MTEIPMNGTKRVLIFRHGSLGDTIVALPCFHLVAHAFPDAERGLLAAVPSSVKAVAPSDILENSGLIHRYFSYDAKQRNIVQLFQLQKAIRQWKPEVLVYLAEPRGTTGVWRDSLFFKSCGIEKLIGVPYARSLRKNQWLPERHCFEHEAERLVRCLKVLGDARLDERASWDLKLSEQEKEAASACLEGWQGKEHFLVASVSSKMKSKDWGPENWSELLDRLSRSYAGMGLVVIGARMDWEYSQEIAERWRGPLLNLCGRLTLRETAAVMKRALFYLGHDSGPMHLAAALGLPCVALFVAPTKPGVWFPYGSAHQVIHHEKNGKLLRLISVDEVFQLTRGLIEKEAVRR